MNNYKIIIVALSALFVFACSAAQQTQTATPTDTLKTFIEATQKKDIENIKKTLSKNSLALVEQSAKMENTTVDELLKKDNGAPLKEMPETRNEKIEGDTASVEIKNVMTGDFDAIPLVREDGNWKIALDKFIEDVKKKMTESMKTAPPAAADAPDANASQPDVDAEKKDAPNAERKPAPNKSKADK